MTHDVFLSYSRKDASLMHRVRDSLEGAGLSAVWTDESIDPGTPLWDQAIEEALHQARCMVVILTPNSKNAKGVRDEIHYAQNHNKRIFPILAAGDVQNSIPFTLSVTQWVDARTNFDQAIHQLVSAIQLHLSRSQANRPPQTAPAASIGPSPVSEQRKRRSKRPAWLTALGSVVAVVLVSLLVLLWANGTFNQPPAPAPTLSENEKALTLAAETQVALVMTEFLTETHIAQDNQTATAEAFTDTPTPTYTASPTDTATPDRTATHIVQATLDARATLNTPVPTETPTFTVTPSATITDTPDVRATQTAQAEQGIGSPMVLVEGGTFTMGTTPQEILVAVNECVDVYQAVCEVAWSEDSLPLHSVTVDSFMLEVTEVTYRQYLSFLNSSGAGSHLNGCDGQLCIKTRTENANTSIVFDGVNYGVADAILNYPVAAVTWFGAKAYCESIGRRLPTEAEWERAARGSENFLYPWGNTFSTDLAKTSRPRPDDPSLAGANEVGSYPPEAFGLYDMAGNVSEWTNDWYLSTYYAQAEASQPNPQGSASGTEKVVRGGSWYLTPFFARSVHRQSFSPMDGTLWIGFRCAADV